MKKLFFYLLFAASVIAQQTVPNFAVKTNLTLAGKTVSISAPSISSLLSTSSGIVDGAVASVTGDNGSSSIWTWNASSTAATNVDVIGSGTGRWIRSRQESTPFRQTGYSVYEPTVTNRFILDASASGFQYNHDASLAYYDGKWFAQWNANTNQYESQVGQVNLQSTSTDFVTWSTPVAVFSDSSTASNPVTYSYATDLQWQPNMANVGSELWSVWSQQLPGAYPTGQRLYFSRLASASGKWTNNLLSLNYTENGMTFYPFPTQNPIQLQSGRVVAPIMWIATNMVSPIPSAWGSAADFFTNEKRAGVIYTDDLGATWKIGGVTTLPGASHVPWEPVVQQSPDGSIRLYCRNVDYKTYSNSQYMLTAAGFSDGAVFGPLEFVSIDTTSSRYGLAAQSGKYPRQIGFANDWKSGGFITDRYNGALTFSRYGIDDFVFGSAFSGSEQVVAYPQGVVGSSDVRVIYSQGNVPRSIKSAVISPAPDPSLLYLLPRRNDYVNPQVAFRSGPPAYFEHGANSVMYSIDSTSGWPTTNVFSFGAWIYRTNNPANEAWADFRSLSAFQGAAVGAASGKPLLVTYSGSSPVNTTFTTLTVPTGAWCYVGFSVDAGAGTATAYVVTSGGTATTETQSISSVNTFAGSVVYIGDSQPGSSLANLSAAVRHVLIISGVAATANNHRYWHGLDQSALGASDWSGTETSPGTPAFDYWAADPNAGSNNSFWLVRWAPTGNSVRGNAYSSTVGSDSVLTVTGTGSAGVEVFPFVPGQQLVFGTQVLVTNKTSGYDQVLATIGGKSNRIDIISRNANSSRIEAYSVESGAYYDLGAYLAGEYIPLSIAFDGSAAFVSVNNGAATRIPVSFKSPRIYLGCGYLDTWSLASGDGRNYKLAATYCHVGSAVKSVTQVGYDRQSVIQSGSPSLALIDTDGPSTNFFYALGQNLRIGSTDQSTSAPFLFEGATGNFTVTGSLIAAGTITSSGELVKAYATGADVNQRRINGSSASPTTIASGDRLGATFWSGYDGTSETAARATIQAEATQTWSVGANGTRVSIQTTPNGSATRATVWYVDQDGNTYQTNSSPILNLGAGNGTSGARLRVFGHSANFLRILDDAGSTRFAIDPSWNVTIYGTKVTLGGTSGPTITTGSGAPSASEPNGSIYLRTGGSPYFYVREGGVWVGK